MKILFISALFPYPLSSGGHVRIYNLLKRLGEKHDITLFAYIRSEGERQYITQLEQYCKKVRVFYRGKVTRLSYFLRAATSSLPLLIASYENTRLTEEVTKELMKDYDLVHCEPFYVSGVVPPGVQQQIVVAEHNIEYDVYKTYARRFRLLPPLYQLMMLDVAKLQHWEVESWRRAKRIVCVSEEDRKVVRAAAQRNEVDLVPNGVDTHYYTYHPHVIDTNRPKFLFIGNFSWFPNREALGRILINLWPALHRTWPGASFTVVGPHIPQKERDEAIRIGVQVPGWVDDIRPLYARSSALIAPMGIGGGTKFKILEAMASGLPVVTTTEGAMGLVLHKDTEILLAQTPEEYVRHVRKVLENTPFRDTLSKNARLLVETRYSWDTLAGELSKVWEAAV